MRAREGTKQDQLRARHRLSKFLLRHGRQRPEGMRAWTGRHLTWLGQQRFDATALQTLYDEYRAALTVLADRVAGLERAITGALPTLAPAQQRLCAKCRQLATKGKPPLFIATTIARELLGFMWAIAQEVEPAAPQSEARMAG